MTSATKARSKPNVADATRHYYQNRSPRMGNVDSQPWPSPAEPKPTPKAKPAAEPTPDAE